MRKITTIDELKLAIQIGHTSNTYYQFSQERINKNIPKVPDTHLKQVLIPVPLERQLELKNHIEPCDLLIDAIYITDSQIYYIGPTNKIIAKNQFPLLLVSLHLKNLKKFIRRTVTAGFIAAKGTKSIKEYRAIICDHGEAQDLLLHTGVPERGFPLYALEVGRPREVETP